MILRQNMARFFRAFTAAHQISLSKLQEIVGVSRGAFYAYSRGEGNPTMATWEHMAKKLQIDPLFIAMGVYDPGGKDVYVLLWNTVRGMAELEQKDRQKFIEMLLREAVILGDKKSTAGSILL